MKIREVKAYSVAGPWVDLCFVKVETDEPGLYGWGEASLPGRSAAVAQAVRDLAPLVVGWDPLATERVWQRMYRHTYWRGGPILTSSLSGIDVALWDIRGKVAGLPVYALLGGPVRDRIALYANIGDSSIPSVLRERAAAAKALGYRAVKFYPLIETGGTDRADAVDVVARCCEAVREEIGADRNFYVDFHGRLSAGLAVQIEAAVRATRPAWIEEPLPAEDLDGYSRLADKFQTPIALGERLFTRWGFREVFERRYANVVQPDVSNAGGISEVMRIAAMAELYGVAFAPHNPNGPLQSVASLHLAAAAPAFTVLEHLFDSVDALAQLASVSPRACPDGTAALPQGPGLGIDLQEQALAARPSSPFVWDLYHADGAVQDW